MTVWIFLKAHTKTHTGQKHRARVKEFTTLFPHVYCTFINRKFTKKRGKFPAAVQAFCDFFSSILSLSALSSSSFTSFIDFCTLSKIAWKRYL